MNTLKQNLFLISVLAILLGLVACNGYNSNHTPNGSPDINYVWVYHNGFYQEVLDDIYPGDDLIFEIGFHDLNWSTRNGISIYIEFYEGLGSTWYLRETKVMEVPPETFNKFFSFTTTPYVIDGEFPGIWTAVIYAVADNGLESNEVQISFWVL